MRILQGKLATKWFLNSPDPSASLRAWVVGSEMMETLVDDQGLTTKIKSLVINELDDDEGIVFAAKDSATMIRGFKYLNDSRKIKGNGEFILEERDGMNLAALSASWSSGKLHYTNKVSAAINTIGQNIQQSVIRGAIYVPLKLKPGIKPYFQNNGFVQPMQSLGEVVQSVDRDGAMVHRGAAIYICSGFRLQLENSNYRTQHRQIGHTLDFGNLATIATKLFSG